MQVVETQVVVDLEIVAEVFDLEGIGIVVEVAAKEKSLRAYAGIDIALIAVNCYSSMLFLTLTSWSHW